jgi:Na+-translocating ferredoxin:NAD+ oxidoreductase RNF subunit RnfB
MLCVNPCPVDCIIEIERSERIPWDFKKASKSRDNYNAKQKRLSKSKANFTQNNISRLKDKLFSTKTNR